MARFVFLSSLFVVVVVVVFFFVFLGGGFADFALWTLIGSRPDDTFFAVC